MDFNFFCTDYFFGNTKFCVLGLPFSNFSTNWEVHEHKHFYYEFHFITDNSVDVVIEDKTVTVKKGYCIIFPPQEIHSAKNGKNVNDFCFQIEFLKTKSEEDTFTNILKKLISINPYKIIKYDKKLFEQLKESAKTFNEKDFFCLSEFKLNFVKLILNILSKINTNITNHNSPSYKSFDGMNMIRNEYIVEYCENFYKTANLNELSKTLCLGTRQTLRIVKYTTGKTFKRYLFEVRMRQAKEFIEKEKLSYSETAEKVGYKDAVSFKKAYKSFFNIK